MAYSWDDAKGQWLDSDNPETGDTGGGGPDWGGGLKGAGSGAAFGAQFGPWGAVAGGGLGALLGLFGGSGGGDSQAAKLDVQGKKLGIKELVQQLGEMQRTSKGKNAVAQMLNSGPGLETATAYAPLRRVSGGEKSPGPSRYDYQTMDQYLSGLPLSGKIGNEMGQFMSSNASSPDEEERRRRASA